MKRERVFKLSLQLLAAIVLVVMCSCNPTHKIIKTGDPWLIYERGLELYDEGEWKDSKQLLDAISTYFTGTPREDSLSFFSARCQFKLNDFEGAIMLLDDFRRRFGRSAFIEDAEGMYALSHYYLSSPVTRDQTMTQTAILTIDEFLSRFPESEQQEIFKALKAELLGRLYEKSYLNAYTYYKIGQYRASIMAFKNAMKEYPDSDLREKILYYVTLSGFELASNSIPQKKEDRFLDMIDSYYTFISEFPESEYRKEADKMLERARSYIDKQSEIRDKGGETDSAFDEERNRRILRGEQIEEDEKEVGIGAMVALEEIGERRRGREKAAREDKKSEEKLTKEQKRAKKAAEAEFDIEAKKESIE